MTYPRLAADKTIKPARRPETKPMRCSAFNPLYTSLTPNGRHPLQFRTWQPWFGQVLAPARLNEKQRPPTMLRTQAARDVAERRNRRNHSRDSIIYGRRLVAQYELPGKGGHHRTSRKNDHRKTRPRESKANSAARERRASRTAQDREARSPPEQRG